MRHRRRVEGDAGVAVAVERDQPRPMRLGARAAARPARRHAACTGTRCPTWSQTRLLATSFISASPSPVAATAAVAFRRSRRSRRAGCRRCAPASCAGCHRSIPRRRDYRRRRAPPRRRYRPHSRCYPRLALRRSFSVRLRCPRIDCRCSGAHLRCRPGARVAAGKPIASANCDAPSPASSVWRVSVIT